MGSNPMPSATSQTGGLTSIDAVTRHCFATRAFPVNYWRTPAIHAKYAPKS
jgi:hypothetical protein